MSVYDNWAAAANAQEALVRRVDGINLQRTTGASAAAPLTSPSASTFVRPTSSSTSPGSVTNFPQQQPQQGAPGGRQDDDEEPVSAADSALLQKIVRSRLINNKHDIEIQRNDPNSPLHSVTSFDALHLRPELLRGVYAMGFNAPSKIQELALPILLAEPPQNLIAQSQSGTGKTAAFVLAMLSRVNTALPYPQVVCLSPTYELALQTGDVLTRMTQFMPELGVVFAVRGKDLPRDSRITQHVVIGTPGKMIDWAVKFRFFDIKKVNVFVLDEADVMISMQGHQDQSIRIHKLLSPSCQMLLFSATYSHDVMQFAEVIVPSPVVMRLKREEESVDNIKQYYVSCSSDQAKYSAIANIYSVATVGQAVIFCHTKRTASWLSKKMTDDGHHVALLSGDLTVEQRVSVLDRFRDARERVLIATNVMCRGIDIEQVTIVVNYDLPVDTSGAADCETYLHRIGRTGRFGKSGLAISLVRGARDEAVLNQIEQHFGRRINKLDTDDVDEIEKLGSG